MAACNAMHTKQCGLAGLPAAVRLCISLIISVKGRPAVVFIHQGTFQREPIICSLR